jgi:hypothetical protein
VLYLNGSKAATSGSALVFDGSNLGLGVTPSAWATSGTILKAIQIGAAGSIAAGTVDPSLQMSQNAYFDGSNWRYIQTATAGNYYISGNTHNWRIAASGTAGNAITFTQAMTLDASGDVQIGTTTGLSPSSGRRVLTLNGSSDSFFLLATSGTRRGGLYTQGTQLNVVNDTGTLVLETNGSERARIDSSGNFIVGGTSYQAGGAFSVSTTGTFAAVLDSGTGGDYLIGAISGVSNGHQISVTTGNAQTYKWFNGGTQSMTLDSSGNLLIGTTTSSAKVFAVSSNDGFRSDIVGNLASNFVANRTSVSSSPYVLYVVANAVGVGGITMTTSGTQFLTSSDYRLKNTIAPMTSALAKIAQLKPVTYKWNVDGSDGQGFIAHELAEVVPECVVGEKDAVDAEGNPKYQGIDTSFLVATLTAAIQEQQAIIQQLQADVAALKGTA